MKSFKYVVYQDGKYFVSQCLNVDVSSFGKTIDEAVKNLADAVELYLCDDIPHEPLSFREIGVALVGEATTHAYLYFLPTHHQSAATARFYDVSRTGSHKKLYDGVHSHRPRTKEKNTLRDLPLHPTAIGPIKR